MPINTTKLVAAAMLQDLLVDKTGRPMANGTITLYHDNSRSTLKNWYYQTGAGPYSYPALPNPLTLSAAGTICDANGFDTIPFYYPWSETDENMSDTYFILIENSDQTNIITRSNFPFPGTSQSNITTLDSFNNLIVNNGFWRNIAPNTLNYTPYNTVNLQTKTTGSSPYSLIVAPSQHDGFRMPDIEFFLTSKSGTDILTFIPFPLQITQPILNTLSPEFYINHDCTADGAGIRYYQFPIALHVNSLAGVTFTGSIQGQNITGAGQLIISILQDTGTGGGTSATIPIQTFNLTTGWTQYTFTGTFPSAAGLTIGNGADDAFYLLVGIPASGTYNLNFTAPTLYLTNNVLPTNDFTTYDQVDSIINSPRTGDLRTSINQFYPYGWVAMNGGAIGTYGSNATARANQDTWQLYNLLWNLFSPYANTTINALGQLVTIDNMGVSTNVAYGTSAYNDFKDTPPKCMVLTQTMGRVLLGTVPLSAMLNVNTTTFTVTNDGGFLQIVAANSMNLFNGMPITFTGGSLPSSIVSNAIYYVSKFNGTTTFDVASTFSLAIAATPDILYQTGTGTVIASVAGAFEGEYNHLQSLNELANHAHSSNLLSFAGNGGANNAGAGADFSIFYAATTGTISGYGVQQRFNVTQPGAFMNIYIKL